MAEMTDEEQRIDKEKQVNFLYDEFLRRLNLQDADHNSLVLKLHTSLGFIFTITVAYLIANIQPVATTIIIILTNPKGFNIHNFLWFHGNKQIVLDSLQLTQIGLKFIAIFFLFRTTYFIIKALETQDFENPGSPDTNIGTSTYRKKKHILAKNFRKAYKANIDVYDRIADLFNNALEEFIKAILFILLSFLI